MKKSVYVVLLISVIFFIGIISAEVPITVKTIPDHDVRLTIYESGSSTVVDTYKVTTTGTDTVTSSYKGGASSIRIIVFVSIFGKKVTSKIFDDLSTSDEIILEVYPDNYIPNEIDNNISINNDSVQNNTLLELDNDTLVVDPSIILDDTQTPTDDINLEKVEGTGLVTDQNKSTFKLSNMMYYIIGGVFILAIIVFLVVKVASKKKSIYDDYEAPHQQIKIRKLSEIHKEEKSTESIRKEITEAEEKLRKAQEQLNIVKNQDKIKEAESRLERDRRELEELRRGRR